MTTHEIFSVSPITKKENRDRIEIQKKMIRRELWICCLNCNTWNKDHCARFNAVPPFDVIVVGCEEFTSEIPF